MNKTPEENFEILVSKLKRHNRACESSKSNSIFNNCLSNVRCFPTWIEVYLKNSSVLELNGTSVKINNNRVNLEEIVHIFWITPDDNRSLKSMLKTSKFDYIYLQTHARLFPIEGMGQAVFPIMSWIRWATRNN